MLNFFLVQKLQKFGYQTNFIEIGVIIRSQENFNLQTRFEKMRNFQLRACFVKCYDLITVGPFANEVSRIVGTSTDQSMLSRCLIQHERELNLPHLNVQRGLSIPLNKTISSPGVQVETSSHLKQIHPESNLIQLSNGTKYHYKYLVYSADQTEWSDIAYYNKYRTNDCLQHHENKFTQFDVQNTRDLYARTCGDIYFVIPEGQHFGYENYFMMHLLARLEEIKRCDYFPLRVRVLNKGNSLLPYCQENNRKLENFLQEHNIELIKNCEVTDINSKGRKIKINGQDHPFDGLFMYCPVKIPTVLKKSKINPYNVNRHLFNCSLYDNVFILGNNLPITYSQSVMNKIIPITAANIIFKLCHIPKRKFYDGSANYIQWVNGREGMLMRTSYEGVEWGNGLQGRALGLVKQYLTQPWVCNQVHRFGFSRYFSLFQTCNKYDEKLVPVLHKEKKSNIYV